MQPSLTPDTFIYTTHDIIFGEHTILQFTIGVLDAKNDRTSTVHFIGHEEPYVIPNESYVIFSPLKTGDLFDKKVCNVCHRLLPTERFAKNQNGKNNRTVRRPSCEECRKIIDGVSMSLQERRKWAASKPHLKFFSCPICHKTTIPGLTSKVVLDHDHISGKARGWICDSCNTGIGRFKDDIVLLENAIDFLKKQQS